MTEQEFDQIEAHLNGEIDFASLTTGKSDAEVEALRAEVAAQREARLAVSVASLRQDLADIHGRATAADTDANSQKNPAAKVRSLNRWLAIAAAVLIAIGAGFWLLDSKENDRLLARHAYEDPGLPVVMGITDNRVFAEAMTDFKRGNYSTALPVFADLSAGASNDTLTYYYGATAFYTGDYVVATTPLQTVAEDDTSLFRERAEWLLALTYLAQDDRPAAKELLGRLTERPDHRFNARAQDLLNELND